MPFKYFFVKKLLFSPNGVTGPNVAKRVKRVFKPEHELVLDNVRSSIPAT